MAMAPKIVCFLFAIIGIFMFATMVTTLETDRHFHKGNYGQGSLKSYQCPGQCNRRCGNTQYRKACLFFCQKCCARCLCVPPGYYGNKEVCPCYNNWKTKRGGPKCP